MGRPIAVFIAGVQKGGTTSLDAHFREHPGLSAPVRKELHVFDDETRDWPAPDLSSLDACYAADDAGRLRYDATPIYGFWPPAMARLRAYNPDARLIFLFRDPLDRAWSQWCMEFARGLETLSFAAAIRAERARLDALPPLAPERRVYAYVERGLYAGQVRRVLDHFPRGQVLFLRSQDLQDDHVATLRRVADFLGVAPFPETGPKREHRRPDMPDAQRPTAADRALVAATVRADVEAFAALTGLDVAGWPVMQGGAPR